MGIPWRSRIAHGRTACGYVDSGLVAEKGIGGQMNRQMALTSCRTGADRGSVLFTDILANGEGRNKNLAEALAYYKRAADERWVCAV